jgi:hypothetical protein
MKKEFFNFSYKLSNKTNLLIKSLYLILVLQFSIIKAQVTLQKGSIPLINHFTTDSLHKEVSQIYSIQKAYPFPKGIDENIKRQVTELRETLKNNKYPAMGSTKRSAIAPVVVSGFDGAVGAGIPNDNNLAVNNDSFVVSVYNTMIRVYTTSGTFRKAWNLTFFPRDQKNKQPGSGLTTLDRSYDPKVVFDPISNRFIIVYLEGSESSDTRIIVAYSTTSNPLDGWNVYQINGKPFGGTLWSDYPMIAINGEDLFITVNILKDNTDWRDGFTQSVIWQIENKNGYDGDTLKYNLWSNIKHNNKPIWSICPVQASNLPGETGLYFLSVRPGDASNDTLFLHHITHNLRSGHAAYSYKVLKTDRKYGLPPFAPQKQAGYRLQTNDARVLGAFYNNNKIQYVQTTNNPINGRSSVFHGIIQYPERASASISSKIISYDTLDIAYPTIVSAGNQFYGQQALITFSHTGESVFPGTSILYFDNNGDYSDLKMTKSGLGYINTFVADTMERWGDYTCIQKKYNKDNEYWVAGSYGQSNNTNGTWISKILVNDASVGLSETNTILKNNAYPNPVVDLLSIPFQTLSDGDVKIEIKDLNGKVVFTLNSHKTMGLQHAIINVSQFNNGLYFYTIIAPQETVINGSFTKI